MSGIKLFGKTIQLGSNSNEDLSVLISAHKDDDIDDDCESSSSDHNLLCSKQDENRGYEEATTEESMDTKQEGEQSLTSVLEVSKTTTSPSTDAGNPKTVTQHKVTSSEDLLKKDGDESDQGSSNSRSADQNSLKKPDKIIPCARCSSMDTKFCYFNNYNVNQPRYFCKNCQRYWTAGGSMRNVPVGAGRRKSKSAPVSQHHHLMIPGASEGLIHHVMRPDGTLLAFGVDSSVPNQSKASMLKLGEGPPNYVTNGFFMPEREKKSSISFSNTTSISVENGGNSNGGNETCQAIPCFPYNWNPTSWQSGFPTSFYPTSSPQWVESVPKPCNLQWLPTLSMNSDQSSSSSSPNTTSLGKHSRDGTTLMLSNFDNKDCAEEKYLTNSRVVIPKTLRIDDPSEAAKSSIWTTLRINNDHPVGSASARGAFFGDLQHTKGISPVVEPSSMVLQANPVALSRSLSFHEIAQ